MGTKKVLLLFFIFCSLSNVMAQRYQKSKYILLDAGIAPSSLQILGIRSGYGYHISNQMAFETTAMYEMNTGLVDAISYDQITVDAILLYFFSRNLVYLGGGGGLIGSYETIGKLNVDGGRFYVGGVLHGVVEIPIQRIMMIGLYARQHVVNKRDFGLFRFNVGLTMKYFLH